MGRIKASSLRIPMLALACATALAACGKPEAQAETARPVLVVKQAVDGPYRRVLTGLDFTPTSDAAALVAAALAPTADLHFMHVFHSTQRDALRRTDIPCAILRGLREREEEGVVARMRRRVAAIGFDSRKLRFAVGRGPSAPTILYHKQSQGADIVAVGRQRRSNWLEALRASVSRRVLARSHRDVLVVPRLSGVPVFASPSTNDRAIAY